MKRDIFIFLPTFFQPALQRSIAQLFKLAHEKDLTTSFDMQSDPQDKWNMDFGSILPHVDLFFPNEHELLKLTRSNSLTDAIDKITPYSNVLAIKRGANGSVVVFNNTSVQHAGYVSPQVVDAIGAGDSFNAGFIFEFLNNKRLEVCQDFANKTGAWSTTAPGGTTAFSTLKNAAQYVRDQFSHAKATSP
ncbi:MAG: carbohydrate kinase family protein [Chitinophagaceae bacterium]|nr:carbohydrate kinase family protein [Chitinophagaceae bacterium]